MSQPLPPALAQILRACFDNGCYFCGTKPTSATIQKFASQVACDDAGNILHVSHRCDKCRVMEN